MNEVMAQDPGTLGKRLLLARKSMHLTQTELGDLCGITQKGIAKIENDKLIGQPKWETLMALARALGVTPAWLQFGDDRLDVDDVAFDIAKLAMKLTRERRMTFRDDMRLLIKSDKEKPTTPQK